jgi:hypothetical protein
VTDLMVCYQPFGGLCERTRRVVQPSVASMLVCAASMCLCLGTAQHSTRPCAE